MMFDLARCPCGTYPWEAPLGAFCPASDPDDLSFHDFASREENPERTLPRSGFSSGLTGPTYTGEAR